MAPVDKLGVVAEPLLHTTRAAVVAAAPGVAQLAARGVLSQRDGLTVQSDAQRVTLGIIAVYVVVIALLWNLPYVRWSLWPFKVW
jgi:hypothetical protein